MHFSASDDASEQGSQFVAAASQWFDSVWDSIAVKVDDSE
jgi:hypothetical protein